MARMLNDKPCEVTFLDKISDSKITLFYRLPTTEERIKYTNAQFTRRANKVESHIGEARQKYGLAILLGFKEGAFETDKGLISSDPQSPKYEPEWKEVVKKYAPDIIEMLALHAYDYSVVTHTPENDSEEDPS